MVTPRTQSRMCALFAIFQSRTRATHTAETIRTVGQRAILSRSDLYILKVRQVPGSFGNHHRIPKKFASTC